MSENGWCGSTTHNGATYRVFNGSNVNLECYSADLTVSLTPAKPGETLELETEQLYNNMWTSGQARYDESARLRGLSRVQGGIA
jgi:hypothetical protein